ncbi:MAG: ATP-binding cassette domain-containing protein [Eubacteriaceae bacterium]|nr:ATP-binding cassette domain-containing protein [Eubacteriaceae bacterium]
MSILKLDHIGFAYDSRKVLNDVDMEFEKGKVYSVTGKSGAGKTTLLSLLSGLAAPTEGRIFFNGDDIAGIDKYDFRSKWVGVIFQSYNLLTTLTAVENVVLSMDISGIKSDTKSKKEHAMKLLTRMGLTEDEANRRVLKLSGGQQQRVAIARALSFDPEVILADEPTGNLDMDTQADIMSIFKNLATDGKCVIIVTHSPKVAELSDEIFSIQRNVS